MSSQVKPAWLCLFSLVLLGCGDDGGERPGGRDGGGADAGEEFDANVPPFGRPDYDAAALLPGDPPDKLAEEACAVDTNKLYEIHKSGLPPVPTQVAVDVVQSQFALAYVGVSEACLDAVYVVTLEGPSGLGEPEETLAVDPCAAIKRAALTRSQGAWLIATEDGREGAREIWVQGHTGKRALTAHNVTQSVTEKTELAITAIDVDESAETQMGQDGALVAWTELGPDGMGGYSNSLHVRALSTVGEPIAEEVVLQEPGEWTITGLTLAPFGDYFIGLGYQRFNGAGQSEIVLDVLETATGERSRESWVLTTRAGARGSVDLTSDGAGAVLYSVDQRGTHELWFQSLDRNGYATKVMSGMVEGGPMPAQRVVGAPYNAVDASLAKLPIGFAVAYRSLPGGQVLEPLIHVEFLDDTGRSLSDGSHVAFASDYGGRSAMEGAYDGRVVLSWSDTDAAGETTLTAVKLPCIGN